MILDYTGFPQSKAQAHTAQQIGVLPRQVFVFLPDSEDIEEEGEDIPAKLELTKPQAEYLNMKEIASAYHYEIVEVVYNLQL